MVGTSNSTNGVGLEFENNPQVNFIGFLQEFLQTEVLNFAVSGGGSFTALENYLISEAYKDEKPKLLVWETVLNPRSLDRSRFDVATDYRRVIPSIYGSCSDSGAVLEGRLELSSITPRWLSSLENSRWRVRDAVISPDVVTVPGVDAAYPVTFANERASLTFPYQTDQQLDGQLLTLSFWVWTASQEPIEARLRLTTQPNEVERSFERVTITSIPQQINLDQVFPEGMSETGFNLRFDSLAPDTTLYLSPPEIVKREPVILVNEHDSIQGHKFYLELEATDVSLVNFNVLFEYQNGEVERVLMRRDERIRNPGSYFLELSDVFTSALKEVRLELPMSKVGVVKARLCQTEF